MTPTLVAVVCMYLVLITPSELLQFYYYTVRPDTVELFNTVTVAANCGRRTDTYVGRVACRPLASRFEYPWSVHHDHRRRQRSSH